MGPAALRAFLADDDPAMRNVLAQVLRLFGFDVLAFEDGLDLAEAVRREVPALVVVDQHMRTWNGTDAVRQIRALGAQCPALFVTTAPDAALIELAERLGPCEVMSKPVDIDELLRRIESLMLSQAV